MGGDLNPNLSFRMEESEIAGKKKKIDELLVLVRTQRE